VTRPTAESDDARVARWHVKSRETLNQIRHGPSISSRPSRPTSQTLRHRPTTTNNPSRANSTEKRATWIMDMHTPRAPPKGPLPKDRQMSTDRPRYPSRPWQHPRAYPGIQGTLSGTQAPRAMASFLQLIFQTSIASSRDSARVALTPLVSKCLKPTRQRKSHLNLPSKSGASITPST
jgi:hypothetical protein